MSTPQLFSEVASVIHAVISVIASTVLKVLPVMVVLLIGLVALDVTLGAMFEEQGDAETPFLSDKKHPEIQLSSSVAVNSGAISAD